MNTIDMHNVISSDEAINVIETSVKTLMNNPDLADQLPAICLRGAPGVGKSSIVREVANRLNICFIDVRLAQMERCDLIGLPSVAKGITEWNIPSFWPQDKDSAGILFFDEITSAPSDCQVAAYSVILDRAIPNTKYKLPRKWFIVAAGNRAIDRAVVKPMSSALANRFMHFELDANPEDWGAWAVSHEIHPSVTGFIKFRPAALFTMKDQNIEQGWPTPRSWERVSNVLPMFGKNEDVLRKVVYGLVGNQVGVEFMEFHRINRRFDDVLEMLTNPKAKIVIPEKADEKYALCAAVAYLIWNGKTTKDHEARVSGFYRIAEKLSADFATMLTKSVMCGSKTVTKIQAISMIMKAKEYPAFAKKYGAAFSKQYSLNK